MGGWTYEGGGIRGSYRFVIEDGLGRKMKRGYRSFCIVSCSALSRNLRFQVVFQLHSEQPASIREQVMWCHLQNALANF